MFAGRLADFGIDYRPIMQDAVARARKTRNVEIIWASTREVFNVVEADAHGLPHHHRAGRRAQEAARRSAARPTPNCRSAAVKSFREDAIAAGLRLAVAGLARGRIDVGRARGRICAAAVTL